MRTLFDDAGDDDRREVGAQRDHLIDGRNLRGEEVAEPGRGFVERDERAQPLVGSRSFGDLLQEAHVGIVEHADVGNAVPASAMRAGPIPNAQPV